MEESRYFALIPAAGRSLRMGEHKLLLPWRDAQVIDSVLEAWTSSRVSKTLVVVREDDQLLQKACERWPVTLFALENETADMKSTVQHGLSFIEQQWNPDENDYCLLAPADLPRLTTEVVNRVVDTSSGANEIVVPWFGKKRGHPISVPWTMTRAIFDLGPDEGLDVLIDRESVKKIPLDDSLRVRDIDTRADYQRERNSTDGSPDS